MIGPCKLEGETLNEVQPPPVFREPFSTVAERSSRSHNRSKSNNSGDPLEKIDEEVEDTNAIPTPLDRSNNDVIVSQVQIKHQIEEVQ